MSTVDELRTRVREAHLNGNNVVREVAVRTDLRRCVEWWQGEAVLEGILGRQKQWEMSRSIYMSNYRICSY